ncbi:hypothetical protein GJ496_009780 [Pomphorhynchus laevis]|nr:hypothetical protein GJ496_009780 [Pomphorhynchus laevis]
MENRSITADKRVYFENIPIKEIEDWLNSKPKMVANASEKYELAKARAIYGTQPKDYLIMAYVLMTYEKALSKRVDVDYGLECDAAISRILYRFQYLVKCPYAAMLDYTDFNIQYTLEIQAHIFEKISQVYGLSYPGHDLPKASQWCTASILNSYIRYPKVQDLVRTKQGLFSGIRGTSFVNTILNIYYFKTGTSIVKKLFLRLDVEYYSSHQGDDLWVYSNLRGWNIVLYHVMMAIALKFERSKWVVPLPAL